MSAPVADWLDGWFRERALQAELEAPGGAMDRPWAYVCGQCGLSELHIEWPGPAVGAPAELPPCVRCRGRQQHVPSLPDVDRNSVRHRKLVRLPPKPGPDVAAGRLAADVCTHCGFVTLWVEDPRAIPIDVLWVTKLEPAPKSGPPFR